MIVCLIFSVVFPPSTRNPGLVYNPDFLWASIIGNCIGKFVVAFLLAGFVWLMSLLMRSKTTSAQFMSALTVALGLSMAAQLVADSYQNETNNRASQQPVQPAQVPDNNGVQIVSSTQPNSIVQWWRSQNPTDNSSDDEITLNLASRYPEAFQTYPDAVADYRRITNSPEGQYLLTKHEVLNGCEIFDAHLFSKKDGHGGIYASKMDGRIRNKSTKTISSVTLKISVLGTDKALIDTKTVRLGVSPNYLEELAPGDVKSFDVEIYIPRVPEGFTWSCTITDIAFR